MNVIDSLRTAGARLSDITERWVPDGWVICMMLTAVALVLAVLGPGISPEAAVLAWGQGVWKLLALGMQFTVAMVAAYACVASRPAYRLFDWLAGLSNPAKPVQAVLLAGVFSMITAYVNWALCLVSCALFTPFILRRNPHTDVRVLIASSYLGLGTVWHGGLSGSAPLILATPDNPLIKPVTPGAAAVVDRLYPINETLFSTFNLTYTVVIFGIALATVALLHPKRDVRTLTPAQIDAIMPIPPAADAGPRTPAERIDQFRGWVWLAVFLLLYPLGTTIAEKGFAQSWTIDAYNLTFIALALLLHGRATSFLRACRKAMDSAWGIIVQFPFYAGIFGLLQFTPLGHWLGEWFARIATTETYPLIVYVYSGFMNLFIPSGGSKWLIEAPFLIPAGESMQVSVISTMLAYAYGDSTTNLIQPYFAIPILAVTRLRFGEIVGYTFLIAVVLFLANIVAMLMMPPGL
jgi:short-chain fatty acids transporter